MHVALPGFHTFQVCFVIQFADDGPSKGESVKCPAAPSAYAYQQGAGIWTLFLKLNDVFILSLCTRGGYLSL
jgi:hypothetical protein